MSHFWTFFYVEYWDWTKNVHSKKILGNHFRVGLFFLFEMCNGHILQVNIQIQFLSTTLLASTQKRILIK